jgi:hydroxymethylpyrimidine pyrophosphatase-like HAD family hydrolase
MTTIPIKAIIADVDGVMVGREEGVNFPLPHDDIITALRRVGQNIPIILCSAKFRTAIDGIILQADLANPHITDGGALIINPLGEPEIIEQNVIDRAIVLDYLAIDNAATELYTAQTVYLQKDDDAAFVRKRSQLLQTQPVMVDSLIEIAKTTDIIKIISFAENKNDMPRIEAQAKRLGSRVHYIWSYHPRIVPRRPCVITAAGVSKEHAARKVTGYLGLSFDNILGVGDSPADWNFMQLCKYVATVGNDTTLQRLVESKGPAHYFHATSVNDHGLLQILEHFGLD